jgi:RNA polymerase sigma-70 factor (sigma-E family)
MGSTDVTAGDADEAFAAFVSANAASLLRTAHLLVGDPHRAEDLLQTALTKAYVHWDRIRHQDAARGYVRKILANTATSWWRRKSSREQPVERIPEVGVPDRSGESDAAEEIWSYLSQLPKRQRTVLVLRFYEDMSEAAVADVLGISRGTAKSSASRGLARLRELMGEAREDLEVHQ